jgi:hypothetical protein
MNRLLRIKFPGNLYRIRAVVYPLFLLLLSVLFLSLNFVNKHLFPLPEGPGFYAWESYDPKLSKELLSVKDLVNRVKAEEKHTGSHSDIVRLEIVANLVRRRFFHGYSNYSLRDNWIAALLGRYVWYDLSAIVDPDDLMKYPMASCSQCSLVMMAALNKLGIPSRKVGLQGHFALEARIGGKWYYADANEEPDFRTIGGRKSLKEILSSGEEFALYSNTALDSNRIKNMFAQPYFGEEDIFEAPNALVFHKVTGFLSYWLWLFPASFLYLHILRCRQRSAANKLQAQAAVVSG